MSPQCQGVWAQVCVNPRASHPQHHVSICVSEGWRRQGVWLSVVFLPLLHGFIECLLYAMEIGFPAPMEGLVQAHLMPPPSPHTPTVRNDRCFLLLHTLCSHSHLSAFACTVLSSWKALFSRHSPPPCRHSSRVSSSLKCATPSRVDSSLLEPPLTRYPPLLTEHCIHICDPHWTVVLHYMK